MDGPARDVVSHYLRGVDQRCRLVQVPGGHPQAQRVAEDSDRVGGEAAGGVGHVGGGQGWAGAGGGVLLDGARWRARRSILEDGTVDPQAGDRGVVERRNGLTLTVRRAEEWEV